MQTLILGGGFGGITVAVELKERLGAAHDVILVDRKDEFVMGLHKLWDVAGISPLRDGTRSRATLARHGVRVVQTEIRAIDPRPDAGSARVGEQLGERGIRSAAGKKIVRVEAGQVVFEDGAEPVRLLIGVPPPGRRWSYARPG